MYELGEDRCLGERTRPRHVEYSCTSRAVRLPPKALAFPRNADFKYRATLTLNLPRMGGWVDPDTMSADAKYFLEQVRIYEAQKQKDREDEMRAAILGDTQHASK